MTARAARLRMTWSLLSGTERAENSIYFLSPTGATLGTLGAAISASLPTLITDIKDRLNTATKLTALRVDEIDVASGHVVNGEDLGVDASWQGSNSTQQLPLQVSEVLTLMSASSGARHRGRIYLPPIVIAGMTTDGYITTTTQQQLANGYAAFFDAINAAASDWEVAIYSRTDRGLSPVTAVRMGRVFDTQRGRRADLVEAYYSVDVTP